MEEATLPGGSFVALADREVVGFSVSPSTRPGGRGGRPHRGQTGLAARAGGALKRAELAWAAQNGIREVVTWTQRGNEGMRALSERLGYACRSVSVGVSAPIEAIALLTPIGTGVLDCGVAGRRPHAADRDGDGMGRVRAPSFAIHPLAVALHRLRGEVEPLTGLDRRLAFCDTLEDLRLPLGERLPRGSREGESCRPFHQARGTVLDELVHAVGADAKLVRDLGCGLTVHDRADQSDPLALQDRREDTQALHLLDLVRRPAGSSGRSARR